MARKVFISVLGASFYNQCVYGDKENDFKSKETRFIQEATLNYIHAEDWSADDLILIALTQKSRHDNWAPEGGKRKNRKQEEVEYKGLQQIIREMQLPCQLKDLDIPDGKDEKEMWEIFQLLFDELQEGDSLYLELTHGFRYLPMLLLVLCNYAKFLKNTTVEHISYGNFEATDNETKITPIVNLRTLSVLQDWTYAAADYLENGYANQLKQLAKEALLPMLKNRETRNENVTALNRLAGQLDDHSNELLTCRGGNIISGNKTRQILDTIKIVNDVIIPPFKPVIDRISSSFSDEGNDFEKCLKAAERCCQYHQYQQAVTILQEGIVTDFCKRHDIDVFDEKNRGIVNAAFNLYMDPKKEWNQRAKDNKETIDAIWNDPYFKPELVKAFSAITNVRNDINHCGFRADKNEPNDIMKKIKELISKVRACRLSDTQTSGERKLPDMLINLSNHPSEKWGEKQKSAASVYGVIHDLSFPQVSASMDETEIDGVVEDYVQQIQEFCKSNHVTVHVMGEMTFTYRLVNRLKALGIRCIASTTERIVTEEDVKKTSVFQFGRFREY